LTITCGIDWAENHHDVALVDEAGKLVAKRRIGDDVQGYRQLLELLADAGDSASEPVPVAVETARGLLISCLRTTGRKVYSINPMAVARYRERHTVAPAKSDHAAPQRHPQRTVHRSPVLHAGRHRPRQPPGTSQHDPPVHHLAKQPRLRRTTSPHRQPGKRGLMRH
jgi:hypothetical protein